MANILIDCDPGHDDAVAILLAESLSNLVSITTVAGNSSLANTTRNALSVTELIGRDIPVHAGASQALNGEARDARHVHGAGGFESRRTEVLFSVILKSLSNMLNFKLRLIG